MEDRPDRNGNSSYCGVDQLAHTMTLPRPMRLFAEAMLLVMATGWAFVAGFLIGLKP